MPDRKPETTTPGLLDEDGRPLDAHIAAALSALMPRFRREYRTITDDVIVTEIFEEAGRNMARHERREGPIDRLHEFAWVTLKHLALAHLRLASSRMARTALASSEGEAVLARMASRDGSPQQIEQRVLYRELLAQLPRDERQLCIWKALGVPSDRIARHRRVSITVVNTAYHRAIHKLRLAMATRGGNASVSRSARPTPAADPAKDQTDGE